MTRLVIMVKSKIFKGYSIVLNRQCYRSFVCICDDAGIIILLFIYLSFVNLVSRSCSTYIWIKEPRFHC